MALVFWFFRKTVAPTTASEPSVSTAPDTTRCPRFWAWAVDGAISASCGPKENTPAASAAKIIAVKPIVRSNFTLLPLLLRRVRLLHRVLRLRAPTRAAQRQLLRTLTHIPRR